MASYDDVISKHQEFFDAFEEVEGDDAIHNLDDCTFENIVGLAGVILTLKAFSKVTGNPEAKEFAESIEASFHDA